MGVGFSPKKRKSQYGVGKSPCHPTQVGLVVKTQDLRVCSFLKSQVEDLSGASDSISSSETIHTKLYSNFNWTFSKWVVGLDRPKLIKVLVNWLGHLKVTQKTVLVTQRLQTDLSFCGVLFFIRSQNMPPRDFVLDLRTKPNRT